MNIILIELLHFVVFIERKGFLVSLYPAYNESGFAVELEYSQNNVRKRLNRMITLYEIIAVRSVHDMFATLASEMINLTGIKKATIKEYDESYESFARRF